MAVLTYTLLRLALVLGAAGLLYILGFRSWLLVVLAVVIGMMLSYLLLYKPRQRAAVYLKKRHEDRVPFSDRVRTDGEAEDAEVSGRGSAPASAEREDSEQQQTERPHE